MSMMWTNSKAEGKDYDRSLFQSLTISDTHAAGRISCLSHVGFLAGFGYNMPGVVQTPSFPTAEDNKLCRGYDHRRAWCCSKHRKSQSGFVVFPYSPPCCLRNSNALLYGGAVGGWTGSRLTLSFGKW